MTYADLVVFWRVRTQVSSTGESASDRACHAKFCGRKYTLGVCRQRHVLLLTNDNFSDCNSYICINFHIEQTSDSTGSDNNQDSLKVRHISDNNFDHPRIF